jgi:hypothetical protein
MASSQKNPLFTQHSGFGSPGFALAIRLSSWATRCCGSQNCLARRSEIRLKVLPLGDPQSAGKIGSHTTRTCSFWSAYSLRSCSTAEAPRRHVGQVGESNNTRRGPSDAESNAAANSMKLATDKTESGCCAGGVFDGPQRYTPADVSKTAKIPTTKACLFRFMTRRDGPR